MSRRGSRKTREIVRSPGPANPEVGTGRLYKSNNGFLRSIAQATMQGRATRCGAPQRGRYEIQAHFGHHLDDVDCRRPDDGARA
jgi:hypothetical protein